MFFACVQASCKYHTLNTAGTKTFPQQEKESHPNTNLLGACFQLPKASSGKILSSKPPFKSPEVSTKQS